MALGVTDIVTSLVDESIADLTGPVKEISARLALAVRRKGRKDLVEMCRDQLALIVLEKRLRVEGAGSDLLVNMVVNIGINALVNGAVGGLNSLKVV